VLNPDCTHPPGKARQRNPLDIRLRLTHRPSVESSHLTASFNQQAALINDIHQTADSGSLKHEPLVRFRKPTPAPVTRAVGDHGSGATDQVSCRPLHEMAGEDALIATPQPTAERSIGRRMRDRADDKIAAHSGGYMRASVMGGNHTK
jgi:hypothetical protein